MRLEPVVGRGYPGVAGWLWAVLWIGSALLSTAGSAGAAGPDMGPPSVVVASEENEDAGSSPEWRCGERHHLEWWRECARKALESARRPPTEDPWDAIRASRWVPDGDFVERFVAVCEEERRRAQEEGRPFRAAHWRADPHDEKRSPCTAEEHRAWARGCVQDFEEIVPGMKRWEVRQHFKTDGGIWNLTRRRFVHPLCPMLKAEVEFDVAAGAEDASPGDFVKGVGEVYVELPISD